MADTAPPPGQPFDVVLLAAGLGSRLGPLGRGLPKALVEVAGETLLARVIAFVTALGPARIVVVGGHGFASMQAAMTALARRDVALVENTRFRDGSLHSVAAALPHSAGAFLLVNVDHLFPASIAPRVRAACGADVTAFCEFSRALEADEMKVVLDGKRHVIRIAKTLTTFDGGYIGMTWVPAARRRDYAAAVVRAHRQLGDGAVAENALQALADAGIAVATASLDGTQWAEVDTPHDHARAEAWLAQGVPVR